MKVYDDSNAIINVTTFWTGPQDKPVAAVVLDVPTGEEIIGLYTGKNSAEAI